jgi:hypothetical protein
LLIEGQNGRCKIHFARGTYLPFTKMDSISKNISSFLKIPYCENHQRHLIPIVLQRQEPESQENIERVLAIRHGNNTELGSKSSTKISYATHNRAKKDKQFVVNQWVSAIHYWASRLVVNSFKKWLKYANLVIEAEKFRNRTLMKGIVKIFGLRVYLVGVYSKS